VPHHQITDPTPNHVRAVFAATTAFFDLPRVSTFGQLAERLCSLGDHHEGPLSSIDLVAASAIDGTYAQAALVRQLAALEDETSAPA